MWLTRVGSRRIELSATLGSGSTTWSPSRISCYSNLDARCEREEIRPVGAFTQWEQNYA